MTIKRPVIKGGSFWPGQDVERLYTRQEVISKAKAHAAQLWKLLVEKLGVRLAKDTMYEIMGDKKPGPRSTDEQRALTYFIRLRLQSSDSNLSDEQIAKRILKANHIICKAIHSRLMIYAIWPNALLVSIYTMMICAMSYAISPRLMS